MGYNKGDTYEEKIFDIFKNKGLLKPGTLRAGAGGKPDIMFLHNGKEYNLEAKENQGADYGQNILFYINGDEEQFEHDIAPAVKLLCDNVLLQPKDLALWCQHSSFVALMLNLLNQGYWFLAEAD